MEQSKLLKTILITEPWVHQITAAPQIISCAICRKLPLMDAVECDNCSQIYCQKDYQLRKNQGELCSTCSSSSFKIKSNLDMSYRMIFDSLLMNCKLCHMEKPMNIKDFKIHLQVDHSKKLETYKGGYEYVAKTAQGVLLHFNKLQNALLNYCAQGKLDILLADDYVHYYQIYLKSMSGKHTLHGNITLQAKNISTESKRKVQLVVWSYLSVLLGKPIYFCETAQKQIQNGFTEFTINKKFNEIHLDTGNGLLRVNYKRRSIADTVDQIEHKLQRSVIYI